MSSVVQSVLTDLVLIARSNAYCFCELLLYESSWDAEICFKSFTLFNQLCFQQRGEQRENLSLIAYMLSLGGCVTVHQHSVWLGSVIGWIFSCPSPIDYYIREIKVKTAH